MGIIGFCPFSCSQKEISNHTHRSSVCIRRALAGWSAKAGIVGLSGVAGESCIGIASAIPQRGAVVVEFGTDADMQI